LKKDIRRLQYAPIYTPITPLRFGKNNSWCSSRINSWSFVYILELPEVLIQNALPILFTDDISVIAMGSNIVDFQLNMKVVLDQLNDWFDVNLLVLNSEKTGFIHFKTKNACEINGILQYKNKLIA